MIRIGSDTDIGMNFNPVLSPGLKSARIIVFNLQLNGLNSESTHN